MKVRCNIAFDEKNLPDKAVYVSNHVSYLDPIILFAFLPGDPIFALNGHLYRRKWIRFLMKTADIMLFNPIEPGDLKELIAKVNGGRRCVIFAEGRMTENGGLMKIYEAPGLLADKSQAPVIPVWINGPQYGYFSKTKGRLPHRPLPRITVKVDAPRSFKLKDELRRQRDHISNEVYMIMREMCFEASYNPNISLFAQLMKTAKVHSKKGLLRRPAFVEDINRVPNSYKDIIIKCFVLGKHFKRETVHGEHVALLLPNSIAALSAFFGLSAYERIPVMLNFSVGAQNMVSMCQTAQVKRVITSKLFIRNAKMEPVVEAISQAGFEIEYLEDLRNELQHRVCDKDTQYHHDEHCHRAEKRQEKFPHYPRYRPVACNHVFDETYDCEDTRKPDRQNKDTPEHRGDRRVTDDQFDEIDLFPVVCDRHDAGDR